MIVFVLFKNGRRTALPRHRTLRATLDWSYQLLSEGRSANCCIASRSLAGPFLLGAASGPWRQGAKSNAEIADGIADLVGKSLVIRDRRSHRRPNFVCSKPTRAYAIDRLD